MTKSKILNWGIIGCGSVTELKSGPAYQKADGFVLKAVMRRNSEKAADYAERHGVEKFYSNADELINDTEIDAIYIATPPDSHKYYALKVAEAGKPCCIEKPLAPSYEDSLSIVKCFEEKKLPLFVAYYRRSLPRFQKVKKWLDSGSIGDIRHVSWHLSKPANEIDYSGVYNWRTDPKIAPGGYFDDLASHGLDLFAYLFGDFKEVVGLYKNQQGFYKAKDAVVASWFHEKGISGTGSWNFGTAIRQDKVEIYGSKGKIEFSVFDEIPLKITNENGIQELFIENPKNIQLYHVQNMRDHLQGIMEHPSSGVTAAHTNWVMDKILGTII